MQCKDCDATLSENGLGPLCDLLEKPSSLRATVGVVCILSMLGSIMIILTYICYREHRTRARYILVHLSISNLGHVISNFIGEVFNFDGFFSNNINVFTYNLYKGENSTQGCMCILQAFITSYFGLSGMLWILCLAFYLYIIILSMKQTHFTRCFVWCSYVICYGLPLLITSWLLLSSRLGYAPYNTPGYCGLVSRRPFQKYIDSDHMLDPQSEVYAEFLGYDLWVCLTIILTMVLYSSALCYLRQQHKEQISDSASFWKTVQNIDYKFLAIPLTFALLRIWSLIMYLFFTYIRISVNNCNNHTLIVLMLFLVGIGNCAQGFVDAVLFVAFTPEIRKRMILFLICRRKKQARKPSLLYVESKNIYDESLRNFSPRYSTTSNSPITITSTRISPSPEPPTSYQDSPPMSYSIQSEYTQTKYQYY